MAQIPLGEFGLPRVSPRVQTGAANTGASNAAGQGAAAVGEALGRAAGGVLNAQNRRNAEEAQQAEMLARAKAANALADQELQVQAAVDDIGDQLSRGGDYTKAGEMLTERLNLIKAPQIADLPPEAQERLQGGITNVRTAAGLRLQGYVQRARRDDGQRQLGTFLDTQGKAAGLPGADIARIHAQADAFLPIAVQFGLDQSATAKVVQDWKDKNWTNQASQRFNAAQDDIPGLTQLQADLTAEDGIYADKLDADKRNAMALKVAGRIDALQAKAERVTDRIDAIAERTLAQMDEQAASGVPATIEQEAAWAGAIKVASPQRQAEYRERLQAEREIQGLLRLPIEQQTAALRDRQAALLTEGGDPQDRANFARLQKAVEANVKLLTEQPLQFAQARGGETIKPLDVAMLTDPARAGELGGELQRRAALVSDYRGRYGAQVQNKLLLPGEQAALVAVLDGMPAAKRGGMFAQLRQMTGSDATYQAVVAQLAPDSPVTAWAGMLHLRNPKAAELVLIGEGIVNRTKADKTGDGAFQSIKLPEKAEFDAALHAAVGTAFRGQRQEAYSIAMQAVRAAYAGAAAKDGDVSGEVDDKRLRNVIKATLGQTVNFNGRGQVFAPYGMDPDDFEDRAELAWRAQVPNLAPGTPPDLGNYGLQSIGDGRYYVTAGRSYVGNKAGKPLVLDLTRPAPPTPAKTSRPGEWRGGARGL